jgi:hypothetical protein
MNLQKFLNAESGVWKGARSDRSNCGEFASYFAYYDHTKGKFRGHTKQQVAPRPQTAGTLIAGRHGERLWL